MCQIHGKWDSVDHLQNGCEHLDKIDDNAYQKGDGSDADQHQDKRSNADHKNDGGRNHEANDDQVQKKRGMS